MEKVALELLLCLSATFFSTYHCYSSGAPTPACINMMPKHRNAEPMNIIPEDVKLASNLQERPNGDQVKVILKGEITHFKGFLIQARSKENTSHIIDGSFTAPVGAQVLNCMSGRQNSLTHTRGEFRNMIEAKWNPPPLFHGEIIFRSTVVHNYTTFWLGVEAEPIRVQSRMGYIQTEQCGKTKGCFGIPRGCIQKGTCKGLVTYAPSNVDDSIEFEMFADIEPEVWIAVALSEDDRMGSDSVSACIHANGVVIFQNSWNEGNTNEKLDKEVNGVTLDSTEYENGFLVCKWRRKYITTVKKTTFNLRDDMYHLLMAVGPPGSYEGKGIHIDVSISPVPVNLTTVVHIPVFSTPVPVIEVSTSENKDLPNSARTVECLWVFSIMLKLLLIYGFLTEEWNLFS